MRNLFIAALGLFALIYIVPLGMRPLAIPDETRYAEIPREMIASGDWVVPHLNGIRYFEKPVLGYWLNAASIALFGENSLAVRLPSAIAAGLSALMLFFLGRKFSGGHRTGTFAAAVFLTFPFVFASATINLLDSVLSMFLTGAMTFFFFASIQPESGKKAFFLTIFGIFCGLAFLVKGFLAFAVPAVAIVPFSMWEGRLKKLFRWSWVPILAAILVILPWAITIHLREGDYWNYFIWTEHINRFISPARGQHPKPFWTFIPTLILGALPWMALLPAVISGLSKTNLKDTLIRFAICWFVFPFLFFSASSGKLTTYILPCFPPLAILIAIGLLDYLGEGKEKAFTIGAACFSLVILVIATGLILAKALDLSDLNPYGKGETWKCSVAVVGFITWTIFSLLATRARDYWRKITLYCMAPLLFMFSSQFIVPEKIMQGRAPERLLLRNSDRISPETILVSDHQLVSAVCWFYKRDDVYLLEDGGELSYGLEYDNINRSRLLTAGPFQQLIKINSGNRPVLLLMETDRYLKSRHLIPEPVFLDTDSGFVFAQF
jgi:4-amino-4-deoxy-L-arabinose transferase